MPRFALLRVFAATVLATSAALALPACGSSLTVQRDLKQGVDPGAFPTYAWIEHTEAVEAVNHVLGTDHEEIIRRAADQALAAKGYRTDPNPAFLVNWHVAVQERIDTATMADYFGYGPEWRTWAAPSYPSAAMSVSTDRDEEGTLVIDLLDASNRELYWRGFATGAIDRKAGIQIRRARIVGLVHDVLAQLPPAK